MKLFWRSASLFLVTVAVACSGGANHEKRVVIMASGSISVTDKTIKLDPSLTHNEQEAVFTDDKLQLSVQSSAGSSKTFDLSDNGVYVLNLQNDTLVGGIVNYGSGGRPSVITADALDHIIDSTEQLMQGANANDAKQTYFIPPFTIKKISSKANTKVIGSFKGIPYRMDADASGNVPDVIKFFTNKQKRETLDDLRKERAKIKNIH